MSLSHKITKISEDKALVEWQGIVKDVSIGKDLKTTIWDAFKRGVEAERDRLYKETGKWPPYD